jgi:alkaline phosphatase D
MLRREFITRLLAAAAAGSIVACSSGDDADDARGDGGGGGSGASPETLPASGLDTSPFTLGVASGDPLPTSVILWTRLAVDPLAPDGSGGMADDVPVRFELSADDTFEDLLASGDATATAALGHSVHIDLQDLEPATAYHYRFRVGEHTSPVGRTRTAPAADAEVDELRFAMASCQEFQNGHWAAHRAIASDEVDVVLFLGDYIYEYAGNPDSFRPIEGPKCITLGEYRHRYGIYKSDAQLQSAHASAPWIVTWDDHEVENNHANLVSEAGATPEAFAEQRFAAYQAYYENLPLRLEPPDGPDWPIHRSFTWGTLAELFVLDGRQYRDVPPCEGVSDVGVDTNTCDIEGAASDMLGAEQEAWLTDGLSASTTTWKVLAQQTVMSSLVIGTTVLNVDQWDGYPQARRRLLDHVATEEISDVVVLTGDIHAAGADVLTTDVLSATGEERPVAVEFVATSVSSGGLLEALGLDPQSFDPSVFGLTYAEVAHRGYCRCTVTPREWRTEFMIVADGRDPDSDVTVADTLTVQAGTPAITIA